VLEDLENGVPRRVYLMCSFTAGPYEVRRVAREQLKRGADFVKIMVTGV
jgi:imidazolonepropionase-like amidohydrolase